MTVRSVPRAAMALLASLLLGEAAQAQRPGRGRPAALPAGVRVDRDIAYSGTANPRQTLDLLRPEKVAEGTRLPVLVAIHGGAFRMGDKGMAVGDVAALVASGDYAAVAINYRLSGEAIWPAQIHDCKAAVRWVRAHADEFGLDPDRIGVIGGSAGGHLAAMLGTSGGVADLEGDVGPNAGFSSAVACVVDQFGPSDLLAMDDAPGSMKHNAPDSPESQLIGGTLPDHPEKARAASPIAYVSEGDPPFLIVHGSADPLVPHDQSGRLAAALRKAGVPTTFVTVEGGGHGGFQNPEIARRIRAFFDAQLRGRPETATAREDVTIPNRP